MPLHPSVSNLYLAGEFLCHILTAPIGEHVQRLLSSLSPSFVELTKGGQSLQPQTRGERHQESSRDARRPSVGPGGISGSASGSGQVIRLRADVQLGHFAQALWFPDLDRRSAVSRSFKACTRSIEVCFH